MSLRRVVMIGVAAAVALLAMPAGVLAAQYPPSSGTLTVSSSTVGPGGAVTISGSGCAAGTTVALQFDTTAAGSTPASSTGSFTAAVTVPSNAAPGTHTITATCSNPAGAPLVLSASVTVTSATPASSALPRTGSGSTIPLALLGGGLFLAGSLLAVAVYRRRHATS